MKRKETLSRLLLTLLTAFVMVAGAFVTAVPAFTEEDTSGTVAVRELDGRTREAGEAPASALDSVQGTFASQGTEIDPNNPEAELSAMMAILPDREMPVNTNTNIEAETTVTVDTGTRAATVDAGGPYGTQAAPIYEGNPVNFVANIVGDINDNYMFRWDLDNDGNFEGPGSAPDYFGAYGDNDLNHQFNDNNIGQAKVEAWDGVSYTTQSGGGMLWNDEWTPSWYMGGYYYGTVGYKFDVSQTITVDELSAARYYYPYQYYNIRLWTAGGSLLRQVSYPYIPYYSWRHFSISPITIPAGEYVLSVGIRGYYQVGDDNPGPTADGIIDPLEWVRASGQYSFPSQSMPQDIIPYIDLQYTYSYSIPLVLSDTADVFIDNVAPIVINPMTTSTAPFYEGADIGFTGWLFDPGTNDDWEYRWDWGDGDVSDWKQVSKYSGGARVLWVHTYSGQMGTIMADFAAEMGPALVRHEEYDVGPLGHNDAPDLDYLLEFDVVIIGSNYVPAAAVGNVLDDYAEAGGGVVELVATFYNGIFGIGGQWRSKGYSVFNTGYVGSGSSVTIYDPSHPIIDGVAGTVSTWGCSLCISTTGITSGAVLLADYNTPYKAAAYRNENDIQPGSGRVAGLNIFALPGYYSGDAYKVIANAAFWASQQPLPQPLSMPIQIPEMFHTYRDDHPTHVTPEDTFNVELQIRDDDHLKSVMVGSPVNLDFEDFQGGYSWPAGWYEGGIGGWSIHSAYELDGLAPYLPYWYYGVSILYSPVYDFTGLGGAILDWDNYWLSGWSGAFQDGYVQVSIDGGSTWNTLEEFHHNDPTNEVAHYQVMFDPAADEPSVQFRFWCDMYNDWYWEIDNFDLWAANLYTMQGLGSAAAVIIITNTEPLAVVPPELYGKVVDELVTVDFDGISIWDGAMKEITEEFWYKVDFDDGTGTGWIYKGPLSPPEMKVLFLHTFGSEGTSAINGLRTALENAGIPRITLDDYNFGPTGTNTPPPLSLLLDYDVVVVSMNYYIFNAANLNTMGNLLADYSDSGGGVIQMTFSAGSYWYSRITGRWMAEGYNTIGYAGNHYGYVSMGDVFDPAHPIMEGVSDMNAYYKHGSASVTSGATRLADYTNGFALAAYTDEDHHTSGGGRIIGLNFFPWPNYLGGDAMRMEANAVIWAWGYEIPTPEIPVFSHTFGDNGVYFVDLMIIDDDMNWVWTMGSGATDPTPLPGATISHNVIPIEVDNTDPVVSPISAFAYLDLVIRTTGEPKNDATMTLWDGSTAVGSVTVHHDGNYKMETLPAVLDVLRINDYSVTVDYENLDPDGANPTWIFQGRFSSGHTKELKKVFKHEDSGTTWTIGPEHLRTMLRGEDIVFSAGATDDGSDDLAFVWNFGDSTPHGLHIFANVDQTTAVDGASDVDNQIFDQLSVRDPWFDRPVNDDRSPDVNPVAVQDMISHAFDEDQAYFFYVMLSVLDDDVGDGYPSTFQNGGGYDMEYVCIDLR